MHFLCATDFNPRLFPPPVMRPSACGPPARLWRVPLTGKPERNQAHGLRSVGFTLPAL